MRIVVLICCALFFENPIIFAQYKLCSYVASMGGGGSNGNYNHFCVAGEHVTDMYSGQGNFSSTFGFLSMNCFDIIAVSPELPSADNQYSVFPNPVSEILNIEFFTSHPPKKVQVFNVLGNIVLEQACEANPVTLNVSYLSRGIYYSKFEFEGSPIVVKFIVN
jgi:hypothetical protein